MSFSLALLVFVALLVGCGGDDDSENGAAGGEQAGNVKPVIGTFVGKASDSEALVAVVAAPPAEGEDERPATVFVCDGRQVCVWYSGSATGNEFTAMSAGGDEAEGELSAKTAKGSAALPGDETLTFEAGEANAAAGLYDLTVSGGGRLSGASAAGVALKGDADPSPPGTGQIKLADGTRLRFEVSENTEGDAAQLRPGQVRLIVLADRQLSGAGESAGQGSSNFLIRSTGG